MYIGQISRPVGLVRYLLQLLYALNIVDRRRHVALSVRKLCDGVHIRDKSLLRDTARAAYMDAFSESLLEDMSLQDLAHAQGLSIEEVFGRLLLSLGRTLPDSVHSMDRRQRLEPPIRRGE